MSAEKQAVDFPEPNFIQAGDVKLAVYRVGPELAETQKPPVVMMHGFPELAYSWRHQMQALGQAGYPVFCPDMPGYGLSDKPDAVAAYSTKALAQTMALMMDHYQIEKAVFIGHDWGALLLWALPFEIPERLLGCGGLNVGYVHNQSVDPIALFEKHFGPDMYIVRFQSQELDEAYLNQNSDRALDYFFRKSGGNRSSEQMSALESKLAMTLAMRLPRTDWGGQPLLGAEEEALYKRRFKDGGFRGALNYYRNMSQNRLDRMAVLEAGWQGPHPWPCLMITADRDKACPPHLADGMEKYWANYTRYDLKNCGHWSTQEQPEAVNGFLLDWLNTVF